jgi:GTPase SAR1 family protein
VGYCWTIEVSFSHPIVYQGLQCGSYCLRYHQYHIPYSDANSYHNLSKWIDNVREVRGEEALILIIGNKKDLEDERAVQTSVAAEEFKKLGLTFMEVSAKTGVNVK